MPDTLFLAIEKVHVLLGQLKLGHMKNKIVGGCMHCFVFVIFYFHFDIGRQTGNGKDGKVQLV